MTSTAGQRSCAAGVQARWLSPPAPRAKYQSGVAVFTLTKTSRMYEAGVGGQKFSYQGFNPRGS
jgi:hypothetical protein